MRSRSHRLPPSDPPDDWGDGSWTVDCSCGVTFDDGEEMVSCDECGVWVHTRCSRFIRGETSFACHNCSKAPNPSLAEETEVAQLLVELPTCPPLRRRRSPLPSPPPPPPIAPRSASGPRSPSRTASTSRASQAATPPSSAGSLPLSSPPSSGSARGTSPRSSTSSTGSSPAGTRMAVGRTRPAAVPTCSSPSPRRSCRCRCRCCRGGWRGGRRRGRCSTTSCRGGGRREEQAAGDRAPFFKQEGREESTTGKKKVRGDGDLKTRRDSPAAANENRVGLDESIAEVQNKDNSSVANGEGIESGGSAEEGLKQNASLETLVKVAKEDENNGYFLKVNDSNVTQEGNSALVNESIKEEDVNKAAYGLRQPKDESHYEGDLNEGSCHVVIDEEEPRAVIDYPSVPDMHDLPDADGRMSLSSKLQEVEVKICMADAQGFENIKLLACPASDGIPRSANQLPHRHQKPSSHSSEILLEHQTVASLSSNGHKSREDEKEVVFSNQVYDKTTEGKETGVSERKQHGQVVEESPSSATVEESSFEATHASKIVGDPTKCEDSNLQEVPPSLHKPVVTADKSSSTSLAPVISRPSVSGSYKALVAQHPQLMGRLNS
ncbi:uncharacterized protein M6B38_267335 [Iris pallida]|uniref:Zinc finger PHD-type domain-containing protein n=1 Tax=Iris pallida TaxID=29817 RepID=A0AAX6I9G0_IRIPA|nr:uncharacterized protein M6B38_267335 [Iris pallida]